MDKLLLAWGIVVPLVLVVVFILSRLYCGKGEEDSEYEKIVQCRRKELLEKEDRLDDVIKWAEGEQSGNPCFLEYASGVDMAKGEILKIARGESDG